MFALDYDGVIADTNALKSAWLRDKRGLDLPRWQCDFTSSVPIIGRETYDRMAVDVFGEEGTAQAPPVPGVEAALAALAGRGPVYIITARDERKAAFSRQWLDDHRLARHITDIIAQDDRPDRPKVGIAEELGCHTLVEDDERHLLPGAIAGLIHLRVGMESPMHLCDGHCVCSTWEDAVAAATK